MVSALLAHNLTRELQMVASSPQRGTNPKRPALWSFASIGTIRNKMVRRAGRLIYPNNRMTLSMSPNGAAKDEMLQMLEAIRQAA